MCSQIGGKSREQKKFPSKKKNVIIIATQYADGQCLGHTRETNLSWERERECEAKRA